MLHRELLRVKEDLAKKTKRLNEADAEIREQVSSLENRALPEIEKIHKKLPSSKPKPCR